MANDDFLRREALRLSAVTLAGMTETITPIAEASERCPPVTGNFPIAEYIAHRLCQLGYRTLFGVRGATCDPMFAAAAKRGMKPLITTTDLEAGYAADGYARMRGIFGSAPNFDPYRRAQP